MATTTTTSLDEVEENIVKDYISLEMIQMCEKEFDKKVETGTVMNEDRFQLAWYLIKSRYNNDVRKGLKMMAELCRPGVDQRDQYYFLALGYYKLEDYKQAELCINRVLNMESNNYQARQLKELILDKIKRDQLITAGLLGGSALVGAVALGGVALLAAGLAKALKK